MSDYNLRNTNRQDYKTLSKMGKSQEKNANSSSTNVQSNENDHADDSSGVLSKVELAAKKRQLLEEMKAEEELLDLEIQVAEQRRQMEKKRQQLAALETPRPTAAMESTTSTPQHVAEPAASTSQHVAAPPAASTSQHVASEDRPTTASLARDKALQAAVERIKEAHVVDLLDFDDEHVTRKQTGKSLPSLFITDYVKKPNASVRHREQNLGRGLVLRDSKQKVRPEEVTEAQWAGATMRILLKMLNDMDHEDIRDYLEYNVQIADYLQVCKTSSVMLLDEDHRANVHEGAPWTPINQQQMFFFLEKKEEAPPTKKPWQRSKLPTDDTGKQICLKYNSEEGCHRSFCRYSHVCSVPNCKETHSRLQHNGPPRFRDPRI
jgi:hypothetical protein